MQTTDTNRRTEENGTAGPDGAGAPPPEDEDLIPPGRAAKIFGVDPKTILRWAASGRITRTRTVGGHGRYRESELRALVRARTGKASPAVGALGDSAVCATCGGTCLVNDGHTCTTRIERPAAHAGQSQDLAA